MYICILVYITNMTAASSSSTESEKLLFCKISTILLVGCVVPCTLVAHLSAVSALFPRRLCYYKICELRCLRSRLIFKPRSGVAHIHGVCYMAYHTLWHKYHFNVCMCVWVCPVSNGCHFTTCTNIFGVCSFAGLYSVSALWLRDVLLSVSLCVLIVARKLVWKFFFHSHFDKSFNYL